MGYSKRERKKGSSGGRVGRVAGRRRKGYQEREAGGREMTSRR